MLTGVHVPLITPFDRAGAVAFEVLEELAHQVLAAGAAGVVALGTTAEAGALGAAERARVLDVLNTVCLRRGVPLIAGANTAEDLRELAGHPAVTAALCLVPPFVRPGEDGVVAHFAALAAVSPVPLVVYHVPHRTGQQLSARAVRRLAAIDAVTGIKYAPDAVDADAVDLLTDPPHRFAVLAGTDTLLSPMLALGAHGAIVASAHLATARFVALANAWQAGHADHARPLGHRLARLSTALFAEPNPAVIKGVLHAQGLIPTPAVRLPLLPAAEANIGTAVQSLHDMRTSPARQPVGRAGPC
ncbi:4-hydroxy-tetrahydrodipicolinate synthase [Sphaerisporangium melleum]|uniref:4-hydroxy-tetrahydrodipicolinate synthase n=2 Tax=Sphaerisporangium melleum TaxID=321316 RepID=A0A917RQK7_9ACTN|nr:4-hydroxy-tetrahydrodipicolinate synthase [Sphaerisporangium melleum]GII72300.1 4-hydroxy-tetrahydrodipicolinate synthase [Sphaerisporangium melleum]